MTCSEFQLQVSEFVDGELPLGATRALFSHLGECDECWEYYSRVVGIHGVLQESRPVRSSLHQEVSPQPFRIGQELRVSSASLLLNSIVAFIVGAALMLMLIRIDTAGDRPGPRYGYGSPQELTFLPRGPLR